MRILTFWMITLVCLASVPAHSTETSGAGSTFVYPLLWKWIEIYKSKSADEIKYLSIGSGGGISRIKDGNVDFGATDMPLSPDELKKAGLGQFPLVIGGVVPIINLEGVKSGQLRFTGKLLADIFLGKVQTWSDPAIKALNPNLSLPNNKIAVVHRVEDSGTTFNWVRFLSTESSEWRQKVGEGSGVDWPTGIGAKGNEGVADNVRRIPNSIGYVEYTYVLQSNLTFGLVENRSGKFVTPSSESFQAAAAEGDWDAARNFYLVLTDEPGESSYPITATTFVLMRKTPKSAERSDAALAFFSWGLHDGARAASDLGYVPLPAGLVSKVQTYWKSDFHFGP